MTGVDPFADARALWDATVGNGNGSTSELEDEQPGPAQTAFERTDLGNAERLVGLHGRDLRFVPGLGWHAWDGRRHRRDTDGEVYRRAKATVRQMHRDAGDLDDDDERAKLAKWACASASGARLQAMVALAETERAVIVAVDELDDDPWLFNVQNGTIDLRSGELREHRREDHLTKLAPVVYKPDARSDLWESFLDRITGDGAEFRAFLHRAVGYSLTGQTSEEVIFFAHGPTATGKSSLLEAFRAVLGEYAATADFETFLKRHGDSGVRNDIARLAGARLVTSVEVDDGKSLAEGLLKLLTGGDTVAARFLYRETFEFRPRFKLWLGANARPRVSAGDDAMWRRILQLPFTNVIPEAERDERVKLRLRTDPDVHAAILAWAVNGCLEWQRHGLAPPASVLDYTAEYRSENDPLRDWLADACQLDTDAWTPTAELRAAYENWCTSNGEKAIAAGKPFAKALRDKGLQEHRTPSARGWLGIRLMTADAR